MKIFINWLIFIIIWGLGCMLVRTMEISSTDLIMASGWAVAHVGFIIADYISPIR